LKKDRARVVDEIYLSTPRIALIAQCNLKTTHHPPVANRVSKGFQTAGKFTNSISSGTPRRVAYSNRWARLALGLEGVSSVAVHHSYKGATLLGFSCPGFPWSGWIAARSVLGDSKSKWLNN
jgi:hypothetical protein